MEKYLMRFVLFATVWFVFSSFASAKVEDFELLIKESQAHTEQLQLDIQKRAGLELDHSKPGSIDKGSLPQVTEPDQVVVSTSDSFLPTIKQKAVSTRKEDLKRISQEINELKE